MNQSSRRFARGHGELVILGLLAKTPMHGYQIHRILCEPGSRAVYILCMGEGTLYPLLHRLEKRGLVKSQWINVGAKRKQRRYLITKKGGAEYKRLRGCWTRLAQAVQKICAVKL
ncbi:PadR family transcriptional regulator [bacterium]|nr:PadR family transcriptional regulator [bacterium]